MIQELFSEKNPIKLWLADIEPGALAQARNLANLPFVFRHIAVMADAHQGYGMPIGGVMATENVIVPNAVGVDIGCGMCAVQTSLDAIAPDILKRILGEIRQRVPLGFKHHQKKQRADLMPEAAVALPMVDREYAGALKQIGTLGGGNHFIEIQQGDDGYLWLMIHSGSRNLGYKVANHYNRLAVAVNSRQKSPVPKQWQLAYFQFDSDEGRTYFAEMSYCVEFALANRLLMMDRVMEAFANQVPGVSFGSPINIAHNYAAPEIHYKRQVLVHRKGATRAGLGEAGIIPGSQGTPSFIVRGRGNQESFASCSHGAGRIMGRKQAQRQLDFEVEKGRLDRLGVIHSIRSKRDLDEAAGAYKDIATVMNNQEDLVEIVVKLTPLAVIKG